MFKCFDSTTSYCDVFFILNLALLNEIRRLKPLPCYCRVTARSNPFEFDTAVARRLKRALVTDVFETKRPPKIRRFSENGPTAGLGPVSRKSR